MLIAVYPQTGVSPSVPDGHRAATVPLHRRWCAMKKGSAHALRTGIRHCAPIYCVARQTTQVPRRSDGSLDTAKMARLLSVEACRRGSMDNVTVLVVDLVSRNID